jgi:hypothetical protein
LRELARGQTDNADQLAVTVDGASLADPSSYRVDQRVFSYSMPYPNVYDVLGCTDIHAVTVPQAVSDGYYVMLHPLPPGEHTIEFSGHYPPNPAFGFSEFTLDLTYHLTVG